MVPTEVKGMLEWYLELGVDEVIGDTPIDRYMENSKPHAQQIAAVPRAELRESGTAAADPGAARNAGTERNRTLELPPIAASEIGPVGLAEAAAASSKNLTGLRTAMESFEHCELKNDASRLVFSDGNPEARLMIVGEAPGQEEDRQGKPFVGRAGKLLDRMFGAIEMSRSAQERERMLYIANAVPWRPPGNRNPTPDELRIMFPFIARHIELAAPEILVLMGNVPCGALIGQTGITRLRGKWQDFRGISVMPMFHPAYLLRNPPAKMYSWWDLIEIRKRLESKI